MKSGEWLGWVSSFLLVLTMAVQLHKQIKTKSSKGVSKWLYLGQFAAEIGFIVYSWMVQNWVFVVTNVALLIENVIGLVLTLRYRKLEQGNHAPAASPLHASR